MMRRLVRHGPATLIISLPADWVKSKGLKEKDEVEVSDRGNELVIKLKESKRKDSITADITHLDRTSIILLLQAIYRAGFSKVLLTFNSPETVHFRTKKKISFSALIHYLLYRFVGFEISKETDNTIELTQISSIDQEEVEPMIKRTFILLNNMVDSFIAAVKSNSLDELEKIEQQHESLTKLVSYSIRAITRGEYSIKESYISLSHVLANIDKIADILKYVSRDCVQKNIVIDTRLHVLFNLFQDSFQRYGKLCRKYDEKLIFEISSNRDAYKDKLAKIEPNLSLHDLKLGLSLAQALELLFDLLEWRMSLQIKDSD